MEWWNLLMSLNCDKLLIDDWTSRFRVIFPLHRWQQQHVCDWTRTLSADTWKYESSVFWYLSVVVCYDRTTHAREPQNQNRETEENCYTMRKCEFSTKTERNTPAAFTDDFISVVSRTLSNLVDFLTRAWLKRSFSVTNTLSVQSEKNFWEFIYNFVR